MIANFEETRGVFQTFIACSRRNLTGMHVGRTAFLGLTARKTPCVPMCMPQSIVCFGTGDA